MDIHFRDPPESGRRKLVAWLPKADVLFSFFSRESYVHYRDAAVFDVQKLKDELNRQVIEAHDDLRIDIFRRVRDGFYSTRHCRGIVQDFITEALEPKGFKDI